MSTQNQDHEELSTDQATTEEDPTQIHEGEQGENLPQDGTGDDLSAPEPDDAQGDAEAPENDPDAQDEEQETFPRAYVEKLRRESAAHRDRAKRADDLAAALWETRVAASGRLADPSDLPMPDGADPLDPTAVESAVEDLLARKPHLATRRPSGNIGQGVGSAPQNVSLAGILRANV